jgi:ligand-binding sensor domain-containing protein
MLPFYRHIFPISEYFVCLLFLLSEPLTAQNFNIQTFTTKDGLSHNDVRAVTVDSSGFSWIATWDGLSRYDGYSFKIIIIRLTMEFIYMTRRKLSYPIYRMISVSSQE